MLIYSNYDKDFIQKIFLKMTEEGIFVPVIIQALANCVDVYVMDKGDTQLRICYNSKQFIIQMKDFSLLFHSTGKVVCKFAFENAEIRMEQFINKPSIS